MSGTSAGAPQWAGILAAGNELRRTAGKGPLAAVTAAGWHPPAQRPVRRPRAACATSSWARTGTCGLVCSALPGYDTVTGLGSPARGLDLVLRDAP
jgi:hypothetical protein